MQRKALILVAAASAAMAVALTAAAASGPAGGHPAILAALNAERAANGIPAHLRENLTWSANCARHVQYMAATGTLTHEENRASPEYTEAGSWAGEHAVLALGYAWNSGNPFASAPLHLIQLMSPELRQIGIAEDLERYLCITTWPGYSSAGWRKPTVYTYPGNHVTGVPFAETPRELPFVPGDFVGIPRGQPTGFNIMVFAEGVADPWHEHITGATVRGPTGPVAVRTVDRTTPTVGDHLPPGGGFVIPIRPLRPGTLYRADVRFADGLRYAWQFETARRR